MTLKHIIEQSHYAANDVCEKIAERLLRWHCTDLSDDALDAIYHILLPAELFALRIDAIKEVDGKFVQSSPEEIKSRMRRSIEECWRLHKKEYE